MGVGKLLLVSPRVDAGNKDGDTDGADDAVGWLISCTPATAPGAKTEGEGPLGMEVGMLDAASATLAPQMTKSTTSPIALKRKGAPPVVFLHAMSIGGQELRILSLGAFPRRRRRVEVRGDPRPEEPEEGDDEDERVDARRVVRVAVPEVEVDGKRDVARDDDACRAHEKIAPC